MARFLVATVVFFTCVTMTYAENAPWLLRGFGNAKCSTYVSIVTGINSAEKKEAHSNMVSWAFGFFSGMNLMRGDDEIKDLSYTLIQNDVLIARVLSRCYEQPEKSLSWLLASIYSELPAETLEGQRN